jgi:mono/diheme cytochrome c family protein
LALRKLLPSTVLRIGFLFWLALVPQNPLPGGPEGARANRFPYTHRSIDAGRQIYLKHCVACHNPKGKPVPRADPGATRPADLTMPEEWVHGMKDHEMLDTLLDGTEEMLGFRGKLPEDDLWHVIRFVQSLWPEELRPKLER